MKLETILEKFDQLAEAPDAVARIRELLLHLAVTGKLVDQDCSDQSGEILLEEIARERLAAVKARLVSPIKPLPTLREEELSFELPPGWALGRLNDLVLEIQTGPFGSSLHKSDYQRGGTPVINPASIKYGKILPIADMAIGDGMLRRLKVFKLRAGDIVMARRGEMGRCAVVTNAEAGWLCGTGSMVLRMPRSLHAPYLALLIGAPMARTYLGGASVGATMQNLNQSILLKMPVGVPPLAEQKRIVAKVDELTALCDRLEARQKERETRHAALARASLARLADAPTPANLTFLFHKSYTIPPAGLRKCILSLSIQGLLVSHDPESRGGWKTRHLKELTTKIGSGSTPSGGKESYQESGVPLIRSMNVHFRGFVRDGLVFLDEEQANKLKNVMVKAGDVLLNITGASIGRVTTAPRDMEGARVNQHVCILRPNAEIAPQFLQLFISSPVVQDRIDAFKWGRRAKP